MVSDANSSDIARLFFWFIWLSGFLLALFFLVRFFYFSLFSGQFQLAVPFFVAFLWQGCVQTTALKRYQNAGCLRDPFLIQVVGSMALVLLVTVIVAFRS